MGKRGRVSKPDELKRLAGNPGGRPLNDNPPDFGVASGVERPSQLEGVAAECWDHYYPLLSSTRMLTVGDVGMLVLLCEKVGDLNRLRAQAAELRAQNSNKALPDLIISANGRLQINPFDEPIAKRMNELKALYREFGLSPSSRADVKALPGAKKKTLAAEMLDGKRGAR